MNKKEIVERSRRELAAADEGPWHVCEAESLDKNPSVGLPMVELIYRGGKGDEFKIIEIFGPDNDRGPANVKLIEHAHENLAACHAEIDRLEAQIGELGVALEVAQTNAIDFATGLVGWACICDKDIAKPSGRDGIEALQYLTSVGKAELVEPDGWYPYVVWRLL